MSPSGYIWTGVGSGALGALVIAMAASNNDLQDAMRDAGADPGSDSVMGLVGAVLLIAAVVLVLIGSVGAGVRAGQKSD